ncbi:MAG: hypothetical protein H6754_05715 [Candidatus Omnitrophica bacterium]|nr:hypothetical protein [Candidatus Omnitrophota bacterium]
MANSLTNLPVQSSEAVFSAFIALAVVGLCFFVIVRAYWVWHQKRLGSQTVSTPKQKPTLFDVRELLLRGEKAKATKVYRQIFKVDQKEAQVAIDSLERNLHQQG